MLNLIVGLIVFLQLLCFASPVSARLSGTAELSYAQFTQETDGKETIDASHMTQQYSLLWSDAGLLRNGRLGEYNLSLGAEFNQLSNDINDKETSFDTSKILYRGDLLLAPGGLPFRFHLYSYDNHQTQFLNDTDPILDDARMASGIATELENGQRIISGATLFVGIRNGHYLGRYRDVLSQFPRLLMDYRETYVRDVHGSDRPEHYRERDLAFVSLNKKDNWFHYRFTDYTDFEDSDNDYREKTIMLGTIDHQLIRRWINMTNWIKISADGSYSLTDQYNKKLPPLRRYDLNLFGSASRSNWRLQCFNSFQRIREGSLLTKRMDVPVFASGEISRNTAWRFQSISSADRQERQGVGGREDENDSYLSTRIETFRTARYQANGEFELEGKDGDFGKVGAARATVEFLSNGSYRPKYDLFGSYSAAYFSGTAQDGTDIDAFEQVLIGTIGNNLTRNLRGDLRQDISYTSGTAVDVATLHIFARALEEQPATITGVEQRTDTFRSITTVGLDWRTLPRLTNRFELVYDYVNAQEGSQQQVVFHHRLNWDWRNLNYKMYNDLVSGDVPDTRGVSSDLNIGAVGGTGKLSFEHGSHLTYSPSRAWEMMVNGNYYWRDGDLGTQTDVSFEEHAQYNIYKINGIVRRLAEIRQEIEYQKYSQSGNLSSSYTRYSLFANYYPIRRVLLGMDLDYYDRSVGESSWGIGLTAEINFEKLQVALLYDYGTSEHVDEQRWEVNVKKQF